MKRNFTKCSSLTLLLLMILQQCALASDWDDIQVHGFLSQNFLYSNKNKFFGDSDDGSFEFFEVGLNASWLVTPRLRLSGQVLARDAGTSDDSRPRIDYLFADLLVYDGEEMDVNLRVGRILNPYGLYSATRDVTGLRPSILLPQSVYVDNNRQFALSSDGVELAITRTLGNGELTLDIGKRKPRTSDPDLEVNLYGTAVPGRLEGDRSTWLGKLTYDYDFGRWKFAWTQGKVYVDYEPAAQDFLPPNQLYFKPTVLSIQHQRERWTFTAEAMRRDSRITGLTPEPLEAVGDNFFLQAEYRLQDTSYFVRYDQLIRNNDDRSGKDFEAARGVPAHTRYAKDWTVGGRWNLNEHVAVNAEFHVVEGTTWLSTIQNKGIPPHKHWNLFMMSVSARF